MTQFDDLFFKGWWALFVLIPCLVNLIKAKDKTGPVIGIIIGILILLAANEIIPWAAIGISALVMIVLIVVLPMVFKKK